MNKLLKNSKLISSQKIVKPFYISIAFILFIFIVTIFYILINGHHFFEENQTKIIENNIIQSKKDYIKTAVDRTIQHIHTEEELFVKRLKNENPAILKNDSLVNKYIKNNIIAHIRNTSLIDSGYIWINEIVNYNGGDNYAIRLIHPNLVETEGSFLSTNTLDIKGNKPYLTELKGIKKDGELFFTYWFKKLNSDQIVQKLTYARLYKKYNWVIATGVYLDDINILIANETAKSNEMIAKQLKIIIFIIILSLLASILTAHYFKKRISDTIKFYRNQIREREKLLKEFNNNLEALVDERTKQLRESEQRYKSLFDLNQSVMLLINSSTGSIIDANQAAIEFYGYPVKQLTSKHISDIDCEHTSNQIKLTIQDVLSLKTNHFYLKHKLANGTIKDVEVYAGPILIKGKQHLYTIIHDISEFRKTQKELILAKEKAEKHVTELNEQKIVFETMFNTITEGVVITNTKREIILANKGIEDTFGYKPEDVIGKLTQLFYADNQKFNEAGKNIFNEKAPNSNKQYITYYKDKDNKTFPGETFGAKLFNSNKEWIGNLGIMRNISERVNFIESIQKAKEQAQESDRLKSAFLANMSHEIRTPMNGILGFAELLKSPNLSGEELKKYIEIIEKSGARMLNIINEIIDISKIESGTMEVNTRQTNINNQLDYIYTFFKPEAKNKNIEFVLKNTLSEKEANLTTDREKIYAVLINLVKNAIKYTDKGSIEFGCDFKEKNKFSYLQFFVKDTGIGIPEERIDAVFERFIQADINDIEARQGAGLGLAISKAYVEMLGGKIWVDSKIEKGSTFYFTIPFLPEFIKIETSKNNESQLVNKESTLKKLKVLIVEDDVTSDLLITTMLSEISKEILHANNGLDAIDLCKNNPDIDLILMDIQLPGINGYKATQQIRVFNKKTTIIAQTAFALSEDRDKTIEAGCNDYIAKPIDKTKLLTLIQKYFK